MSAEQSSIVDEVLVRLGESRETLPNLKADMRAVAREFRRRPLTSLRLLLRDALVGVIRGARSGGAVHRE